MAKLSTRHLPVAKLALMMGYPQHLIAARLGEINQGRISEFKNGPLFDVITPAEALPLDWDES